MKRGDSLLGQDVGLSPIVQQSGSDLHLVLLGSNVQRRVPILAPVGKQHENKGDTTAVSAEEARPHKPALFYITPYC